MSDLRGLSKPPTIETGDNTARFVSAFVVAAVAVGAAGYVYVSANSKHPAHQVVAMNDVRTAALPSAASRVAPPMVSPAPAPAVIPTPTPEPAPVARGNEDTAPVKAAHMVRTAHTNSESFANHPASDTPSGNDTTQPAPPLNTAPEQPAPQNNLVAPAPDESPQTPSQPAQTPDQNTQQNNPQATDTQNAAPQQNNPQNSDPQNAPQQTPPQPQ